MHVNSSMPGSHAHGVFSFTSHSMDGQLNPAGRFTPPTTHCSILSHLDTRQKYTNGIHHQYIITETNVSILLFAALYMV